MSKGVHARNRARLLMALPFAGPRDLVAAGVDISSDYRKFEKRSSGRHACAIAENSSTSCGGPS